METKGLPQNIRIITPKHMIITYTSSNLRLKNVLCLLCKNKIVDSLMFLFTSFLFWDSFIFIEKLQK